MIERLPKVGEYIKRYYGKNNKEYFIVLIKSIKREVQHRYDHYKYKVYKVELVYTTKSLNHASRVWTSTNFHVWVPDFPSENSGYHDIIMSKDEVMVEML